MPFDSDPFDPTDPFDPNLRATNTYNDIHLVAHSMGNVVVSEALLHHEVGQLVTSFTASEAATVAGAYSQTEANIQHKIVLGLRDIDCSTAEILGPEDAWRCYNLDSNDPYEFPPDRYRYTVPLTHGPTTDAEMALQNTGSEYYQRIRNAAGRIINFYNPFDAALNAWEFNQLTKPDELGGDDWSYSYFLRGDDLVEDSYKREFQQLEWHEGTPMTKDNADILGHIIPSRTHALGQRPISNTVITSSINMREPPYFYTSSNQGHSAQFHDTYAVRQVYWRNVLNESLQLSDEEYTNLR